MTQNWLRKALGVPRRWSRGLWSACVALAKWAGANDAMLLLALGVLCIGVGVGGYDWRAGLIAFGASTVAVVFAVLQWSRGNIRRP